MNVRKNKREDILTSVPAEPEKASLHYYKYLDQALIRLKRTRIKNCAHVLNIKKGE
jgi:hypothetical protein